MTTHTKIKEKNDFDSSSTSLLDSPNDRPSIQSWGLTTDELNSIRSKIDVHKDLFLGIPESSQPSCILRISNIMMTREPMWFPAAHSNGNRVVRSMNDMRSEIIEFI